MGILKSTKSYNLLTKLSKTAVSNNTTLSAIDVSVALSAPFALKFPCAQRKISQNHILFINTERILKYSEHFLQYFSCKYT